MDDYDLVQDPTAEHFSGISKGITLLDGIYYTNLGSMGAKDRFINNLELLRDKYDVNSHDEIEDLKALVSADSNRWLYSLNPEIFMIAYLKGRGKTVNEFVNNNNICDVIRYIRILKKRAQ
jgi:hypothetical protein